MEFSKVTNSKSKVWEHFTKNVLYQKAKCNKCGKTLSINQGSTKSLIGHLKNKHNIFLESSINKKTKNEDDAVNLLPQQKRSRLQEHLDEALEDSDNEDVLINLDENMDENFDSNVTISQNEFIEIEKAKKARADQIESNFNEAFSEPADTNSNENVDEPVVQSVTELVKSKSTKYGTKNIKGFFTQKSVQPDKNAKTDSENDSTNSTNVTNNIQTADNQCQGIL